MPSINDWAAKAARKIFEDCSRDCRNFSSEEHVAATFSYFAEPLIALLMESKREHGYDDEGDVCLKVNQLDGLGQCTCGADAWNARVDSVISGR